MGYSPETVGCASSVIFFFGGGGGAALTGAICPCSFLIGLAASSVGVKPFGGLAGLSECFEA